MRPDLSLDPDGTGVAAVRAARLAEDLGELHRRIARLELSAGHRDEHLQLEETVGRAADELQRAADALRSAADETGAADRDAARTFANRTW